MSRYAEKREWILDWMKRQYGKMIPLYEGDFHEAYHKRFGTKLTIYTIGPNRCNDAVRTLRKMWEDGDVKRSVMGNQDARYYCQPNWSLLYSLPDSKGGYTYREYTRRPIRFKRRRKR
jgi:hypothetical protein